MQTFLKHHQGCPICRGGPKDTARCRPGRQLVSDLARYFVQRGKMTISLKETRGHHLTRVEIPLTWAHLSSFFPLAQEQPKILSRPIIRRYHDQRQYNRAIQPSQDATASHSIFSQLRPPSRILYTRSDAGATRCLVTRHYSNTARSVTTKLLVHGFDRLVINYASTEPSPALH